MANLNENMSRQGVSTESKGLCAACSKPIIGQVLSCLLLLPRLLLHQCLCLVIHLHVYIVHIICFFILTAFLSSFCCSKPIIGQVLSCLLLLPRLLLHKCLCLVVYLHVCIVHICFFILRLFLSSFCCSSPIIRRVLVLFVTSTFNAA